MKNVLIIGATGSFGSALRKRLQIEADINVTLFSRSAGSLTTDSKRETIKTGDATNINVIEPLIGNQDFIFSAVSGKQIISVTKNLVSLIEGTDKYLVLVSSLGVYNEIPQAMGSNWNLNENAVLKPYREAADIVEKGAKHYTVIRPGWINQGPTAQDYEVTEKGQPFGGRDVSPENMAKLVLNIIRNPQEYNGRNLGINDK
ncbi:NAD(P)H-binding protein [Furfurilactobacillus rossiae]|nr:NAD(P)H-binding protein [Furfurilactobacillus rossiae]QLE62409.1 hypothetical protein LROSRS0_2364 [Furfurilactobacillus rossiae]